MINEKSENNSIDFDEKIINIESIYTIDLNDKMKDI